MGKENTKEQAWLSALASKQLEDPDMEPNAKQTLENGKTFRTSCILSTKASDSTLANKNLSIQKQLLISLDVKLFILPPS